ncbi:hypothetical protein PI125_g402 [Phytophthora idaei]|nr:hypothetical protein PI125_g402 [Phytophthora idaei]
MQSEIFYLSDSNRAGDVNGLGEQSNVAHSNGPEEKRSLRDYRVEDQDYESKGDGDKETDLQRGHRQGWRRDLQSKRRKSVTLAEGMMSVHESRERIAGAVKISRQESRETSLGITSSEFLMAL